MDSILTIRDLKKSFARGFLPQRQEVLRGIDFQLRPGAITGFLGANGAGKTTTIKAVLGLIHPDGGEILFFGGQKLSPQVKTHLGYLPERPYFYDYLTGQEILLLCGQLSGMKRSDIDQRMESLLKRVDLWHAKDKRLKNYSKGMLQKIGLVQALLHRPKLVVLDEPMSGLDPDGRFYVRELILETAKNGATVFFSSHHMHDTEQICQDLVMMKDGKVIYSGLAGELMDRMGVKYEVIAQGPDGIRIFLESDPNLAQKHLGDMVAQGLEVTSVRQVRASLEEVFIKLALRGEKS